MKGTLTEYGEEVSNKNWENNYQYVARVDSQIEFVVRRSLLEKLQESFYPIWTADTYINYFDTNPSGFIVLLKVYRAKRPIDPVLLEKGRQG